MAPVFFSWTLVVLTTSSANSLTPALHTRPASRRLIRTQLMAATGNRAAEAHVAASKFPAVTLKISARQINAAAMVEEKLCSLYDSVDYERALNRAEKVVAPFEGEEDDEGTTYGEFPIDFFASILDILDPPPDATFLDLGSGRGQIVFAAAMLRRWTSLHGVEIIPELHFIADEAMPDTDAPGMTEMTSNADISFHLGDIFNFNTHVIRPSILALPAPSPPWFVFVYATCLKVDHNGGIDSGLDATLESLPINSTVVTINRPLASSSGSKFQLQRAFRGPNPEAADSEVLSTAFVWAKVQ